jgi:hypothetical protein
MKRKELSSNEKSVSPRPPTPTGLPKQVQPHGVVSLRDRPAEAVDPMIQPAAKMALAAGDFIPQAHRRPVVSLGSSIKLIAEHASTTTQVLYEIHERYNAYYHDGLNE